MTDNNANGLAPSYLFDLITPHISHSLLSVLRVQSSSVPRDTKRNSQQAAGPFPVVPHFSGKTSLMVSDKIKIKIKNSSFQHNFQLMLIFQYLWSFTYCHHPYSRWVSVSVNLLTLVLMLHVYPAYLSLSLPLCFCLSLLSVWMLYCLFRVCFSRSPGLGGGCVTQVLPIWHLKAAKRPPGSILFTHVLHSTQTCIFCIKMCIYCVFLLIYSVHGTSIACLSVLGEGSRLCSSSWDFLHFLCSIEHSQHVMMG